MIIIKSPMHASVMGEFWWRAVYLNSISLHATYVHKGENGKFTVESKVATTITKWAKLTSPISGQSIFISFPAFPTIIHREAYQITLVIFLPKIKNVKLESHCKETSDKPKARDEIISLYSSKMSKSRKRLRNYFRQKKT